MMDIKNRANENENETVQPNHETDSNFLKMPYGKYSGTLIKDLPDNYLQWVSENWGEDSNFESEINNIIRQAAEDEIDYKYANGVFIMDDSV